MTVRFAPGIAKGRISGETVLEYAFYVLSDLDGYNPLEACGFEMGGLQMTEFTPFERY